MDTAKLVQDDKPLPALRTAVGRREFGEGLELEGVSLVRVNLV